MNDLSGELWVLSSVSFLIVVACAMTWILGKRVDEKSEWRSLSRGTGMAVKSSEEPEPLDSAGLALWLKRTTNETKGERQ